MKTRRSQRRSRRDKNAQVRKKDDSVQLETKPKPRTKTTIARDDKVLNVKHRIYTTRD